MATEERQSKNEQKLKLRASMTTECPDGVSEIRWKTILKIVKKEQERARNENDLV